MTPRKPLPEVAPCPTVEWSNRHGCYIVKLPVDFRRVGRATPDVAAERRGAMAVVGWMLRNYGGAAATFGIVRAMRSGEVMPAARKGKRT